MVWIIEYRPLAIKHLKKLDRNIQKEIVSYLQTRLATSEDPRIMGKPLKHSMYGLWRYRIRDYRIICKIDQQRIVVVVLAIGHRKNIYDE